MKWFHHAVLSLCFNHSRITTSTLCRLDTLLWLSLYSSSLFCVNIRFLLVANHRLLKTGLDTNRECNGNKLYKNTRSVQELVLKTLTIVVVLQLCLTSGKWDENIDARRYWWLCFMNTVAMVITIIIFSLLLPKKTLFQFRHHHSDALLWLILWLLYYLPNLVNLEIKWWMIPFTLLTIFKVWHHLSAISYHRNLTIKWHIG